MLNAYIEAIYFTETGDIDQPSAEVEISTTDSSRAHLDCRTFKWALDGLPTHLAPADLDSLWEQIGHDLWLTRNGQGAGFWDRPELYGKNQAAILTAMARAMGRHEVTFD